LNPGWQLASRQLRRLVPEFFGLGPELCDFEILRGLDGGGDQFCFETERVGFDAVDDRPGITHPKYIVARKTRSILFEQSFQNRFGLSQLPHMEASHGNGDVTPTVFVEFLFNIKFEILTG
jgi:hypothetical protein